MTAEWYEAETQHGDEWRQVLTVMGDVVRRYDTATEARDCTRYIRYAPVRIVRVHADGRREVVS